MPEVLIHLSRPREETSEHQKTEDDEEERAGLCPKPLPIYYVVHILF